MVVMSQQQWCIIVPLPSVGPGVALAGTVSGSGSERNSVFQPVVSIQYSVVSSRDMSHKSHQPHASHASHG